MYEITITIRDKGTLSIVQIGDKRNLAEHGSDVVKLLQAEVENAQMVVQEQDSRQRSTFGRIMRWLAM